MGSALSTLPERLGEVGEEASRDPSRDQRGIEAIKAVVTQCAKYELAQKGEISDDVAADIYNQLASQLTASPMALTLENPEDDASFLHFLVVDDSPLAVIQASSMLRAAAREAKGKYRINTANSGEAALATLRDMHAKGARRHIVLLDLVMPGMSGIEVLIAIRDDAELGPVTSANVFTGVDDQASCLNCLKLGAERVLFKPFTMRKALQLCMDIGIEIRPGATQAETPRSRKAAVGGNIENEENVPTREREKKFSNAKPHQPIKERRGSVHGPDALSNNMNIKDGSCSKGQSQQLESSTVPSTAVLLDTALPPTEQSPKLEPTTTRTREIGAETEEPEVDLAEAYKSVLYHAKPEVKGSLEELILAGGGKGAVFLFLSSIHTAQQDKGTNTSLVARSLLTELQYYAGALSAAGVAVVTICMESRPTMASLEEELGLSFPIVSDPSLVVASAFIGTVRDDYGTPVPRSGFVVLDSLRAIISRSVVPNDSSLLQVAPWALEAYNAAEVSFYSVCKSSNKKTATISVHNLLHNFAVTEEGGRLGPISKILTDANLGDVVDAASADALKTLATRVEAPGTEITVTASRCVLVVEDSSMSADLMIRKLLRLGHSAMYAADGRDALKLLRQCSWTIAIVISDVLMPQMDGVELLSRIKTDASLKRTPVILLTGMQDGDDLETICDDLGGSQVLQKPLAIGTLKDVIASLCP